MDNTPWLIVLGNCCLMPVACICFGIWIGANRIRLRSPIMRAGEKEVYAAPPNERAREYVRTQINKPQSAKPAPLNASDEN